MSIFDCESPKGYVNNGFKTITQEGVIAYKSKFSSKRDEYRVAVLRVFLKQMYFLEFSSVSEDVLELISKWKLSGNEKGIAVLSLDPEEGPYSDTELEAIRSGLDNKYAESVIDDEENFTWDKLCGLALKRYSIAATRQTLQGYSRIKSAYDDKKEDLSANGKRKEKHPPSLGIAGKCIATLEAENSRLKKEQERLLSQFVV
jgi:hypothetical protein